MGATPSPRLLSVSLQEVARQLASWHAVEGFSLQGWQRGRAAAHPCGVPGFACLPDAAAASFADPVQVLLFYPDGKRSSSTENIQPQAPAVPAAVAPAGLAPAAAVAPGQPGANPAAAPAPAAQGATQAWGSDWL